MPNISRRNGHREASAWPGWVDALSSLVMVVIFLLMIFVVAQFYMATALTGRDEQLGSLNRKVAELNDLLALERDANADLRINVAQLSAELQGSVAARDTMTGRIATLQGDLDHAIRAAEELQRTVRADKETIELKLAEAASLQADLKALREARTRLEGELAAAAAQQRLTEEQRQALLAELGGERDRSKALETRLASADEKTMLAQKDIEKRDIRITELMASLSTEQGATGKANEQVDLLNRQMAALREQLARIGAALEISEKKAEEQQVQIAELGSRLNQALAAKVQDLARYRSEFFGRVREALGNRPDVRIVGDRFVFQSELLFPSGSATLEEAGKQRLAELARTLIEIGRTIPPDINWVLRVDGHTDSRPVRIQFASNWELSAARAISVVKYLIDQGIPAGRLAAAGFGEYQPLDPGTSDEALARNRRIEVKLDQR
ncbi:chemotaxis protein [Azospirillum sp. TSH58]|uniref:peptidoglycan -binding protein n=1 Tax=Azospirillum sp. TSH58 TaxID=664962 RepID=UPI000D60064B|nr:peptidoglycan -binding protein [Azospirillum sp. TSH58]AWJ84920.1 chemotaxis protein [Azospirillum sp. TSH58]PWC65965.1 chemotaxis protein [Azospirillum sp. TSH58]